MVAIVLPRRDPAQLERRRNKVPALLNAAIVVEAVAVLFVGFGGWGAIDGEGIERQIACQGEAVLPMRRRAAGPVPLCGATVSGNDRVHGVCQQFDPPPTDYGLRLVLVDRLTGEMVPGAGLPRLSRRPDGV